MSNHKNIAIELNSVSKSYKLYPSPLSQAVDVLGFRKVFFWKNQNPYPTHKALNNIDIKILKGQKIGILGRNGAGKSTLLKLITKNYIPSSGKIFVNGKVQSLMDAGVGFHPDYTGYENISASLIYNDLDKKQINNIMDDIIDFVELGDYLHQPVKTYSNGMLARLGFATATAIAPDILLIDEVLSAGDAYFIAKCRSRITKLVEKSKCTLLLVSHSMSQVLEFCDYAFWLNNGKIVQSGEVFQVVKKYEEFMNGEISEKDVLANTKNMNIEKNNNFNKISNKLIQEPNFVPFKDSSKIKHINFNGFNFIERGGISRWGKSNSLIFNSFTMANNNKQINEFISMKNARFLFTIKALKKNSYNCRYAICIYDSNGKLVSDILSGNDSFNVDKDDYERLIELQLIPIQLGSGEYSVSLSIHDYAPIELLNSTKRYDLLNRSFTFTVKLNESFECINSAFFHPGQWQFRKL